MKGVDWRDQLSLRSENEHGERFSGHVGEQFDMV
jgi:hypothetical protein